VDLWKQDIALRLKRQYRAKNVLSIIPQTAIGLEMRLRQRSVWGKVKLRCDRINSHTLIKAKKMRSLFSLFYGLELDHM
jgi:hypothetical protein